MAAEANLVQCPPILVPRRLVILKCQAQINGISDPGRVILIVLQFFLSNGSSINPISTSWINSSSSLSVARSFDGWLQRIYLPSDNFYGLSVVPNSSAITCLQCRIACFDGSYTNQCLEWLSKPTKNPSWLIGCLGRMLLDCMNFTTSLGFPPVLDLMVLLLFKFLIILTLEPKIMIDEG
jgi:hypothetical protein